MLRRVAVSMVVWCVISACRPCSQARANTYLPPYRPITQSELLLTSCEDSDAILVIKLKGIQDEFFADATEPSGGGVYVPIATCLVLRALKGPHKSGETIRVQLSRNDPEPDRSTGFGVLFLRRWGGIASRWKASDRGAFPSWAILSGPDQFDRGFTPAEKDHDSNAERQIRHGLEMIEPDSMASIADLVIEGHVGPNLRGCMVGTTMRACFDLSTRNAIYGESEQETIQVVAAAPGFLRPGHQLLYLKRLTGSVYEIIGLTAGAQAIRNNVVGHNRQPLGNVLKTLERAETARKARKGASR